jgi:hypothetical protein
MCVRVASKKANFAIGIGVAFRLADEDAIATRHTGKVLENGGIKRAFGERLVAERSVVFQHEVGIGLPNCAIKRLMDLSGVVCTGG